VLFIKLVVFWLSYAKVSDIIFENFGYILTTLTMKKTTLSNLKYKNLTCIKLLHNFRFLFASSLLTLGFLWRWIKSSFVDLDGWKNGWFWFGLEWFLRGDYLLLSLQC
jgi:hypothetical protein